MSLRHKTQPVNAKHIHYSVNVLFENALADPNYI